MKNSEMRPPGTAPLPEAHKAEQEKKDPKESNHVYNERRTHGRGRGGYKGRGSRDNYTYGRGYGNHNNHGRGPNYGCGRATFGPSRGESLKDKNPEAHMVHDNGYDADDFDHEKDDLMDHETSDCLKD
ncbi:PREDICTED: uncharacterized protein LOC106319560 [Brassica oleracea var. oleracea]|uniref:uncharacterized protein LOC106319560 n=1 Tax=Brassica oleracea var. oleracea TaxID=109376 RepID=UPI0006A71037|nr:PREDICTED: uncharacterized protein LOC106319560 [Brassica oleracea var. oleracea]